jgi:hypothetical protein
VNTARRSIGWTSLALAAVTLALLGGTAATAGAAAARWQISSSSAPRNLQPGGEGQIGIAATNIGSTPVNAVTEPLTITDRLPPGLEATVIAPAPFTYAGYENHGASSHEYAPLTCTLPSPTVVTCTWGGEPAMPEPFAPYETLEARFAVKIKSDAVSGERNEVSVTGGDAPSTSLNQPITVDGAPTPFGVERNKLKPENADGSIDMQAGSHPFQLTDTLDFNQALAFQHGQPWDNDLVPTTAGLPKDLRFQLPPGLVGNPTPFPQCTDSQFDTFLSLGVNLCQPNAVVGVASVTAREPFSKAVFTTAVPLFNLVPAPGEPARFGFDAISVPVILDTSVRTGGDYGVTVRVNNLSQAVGLLSSRVTFWGVPGDPRHDQSRGWSCLQGGYYRDVATTLPPCSPLGQSQPAPLLTLPTSCARPLSMTLEGQSWAASPLPQSEYTLQDDAGQPLMMEGCNRLPFNPSIEVQPEAATASTPTGVTVSVHVPRAQDLIAAGLAASSVKETTVALPEGMQLSPAAADGLQACSEAQVGFQGFDGTGTNLFTSSLPNPFCPDASKVGTAYIKSPLLANPLEGAVYLAAQNANPFASLVAMYIVAEDPISGVLVKLAGEVKLSDTGRILTTFKNTPDLPFEELKLHFFEGPRAPLSTPPYCGSYTTAASLTPWSGNPPASSSSTFNITSGPGGASCENPLPFSPSLTAGSLNLQAAAFTPFTTTMSREDGHQNLASITMHMPPGLLGKLSTVTPCKEPQAAQGTCGAESLIGHTVTSVGLGSDPYSVPGTVFVTGPYKGAPYGLSIVTPAVAGPFNLGLVVVRAKIDVDPHTAALTIASDPLPTILQGIPLQIKHVHVTIDRPGFTFNPTNCTPQPITATITGEQRATAPVSVPFQVANCATLPFKPTFQVLTQARTSKANGASLHVKVTSGPGQANIAKVKVELPKQLPSRLTTLHKACPDATFSSNHAACPAGSVVGTATTMTPVLKAPLSGPAYLVSHAGTAFPDLVLVLQGEGITLELVGNTDIKKGITTSTFNAVPDAPISTFDLVLPQGPHSALAAYGSLCKTKLSMPTVMSGQNGAVTRQSTKIAVSGCAKHKPRRKARGTRGKRRPGRR